MVSFSETVFLITVTKCLLRGPEEKEGVLTVSECSLLSQRQLGGGITRQQLLTWGGQGSHRELETARAGRDLQRPVPSAGPDS